MLCSGVQKFWWPADQGHASMFSKCTWKNFATTALRAGTAVGRVARARRDGRRVRAAFEVRWPHRWRLLTAQTRWRSLRACDALPAPASHPSTRPAPVGPSASGPASSHTLLLHAWPRSWAGIADVATSVSTWTAPIQRSRLQSSSFGRICITPKPSSRQAPLPRPSSASSLPSRASERGCRPTSVVSCI